MSSLAIGTPQVVRLGDVGAHIVALRPRPAARRHPLKPVQNRVHRANGRTTHSLTPLSLANLRRSSPGVLPVGTAPPLLNGIRELVSVPSDAI